MMLNAVFASHIHISENEIKKYDANLHLLNFCLVTYCKDLVHQSTDINNNLVWGEGYWVSFLCSLIFLHFSALSITGKLVHITFIFDRCHCSEAAVTPVKYGCDSKNLTGTFVKINIFVCGKNNKWTFSNPHPRCTFIKHPSLCEHYIHIK